MKEKKWREEVMKAKACLSHEPYSFNLASYYSVIGAPSAKAGSVSLSEVQGKTDGFIDFLNFLWGQERYSMLNKGLGQSGNIV